MLPTKKERKQVNPQNLLIYGASKSGKTYALSNLDNCLIIDTEKGSRLHNALSVEVNNIQEIKKLYAELKKDDAYKNYEYLAFDTIDNIVYWLEQQVISEHNAELKKKNKPEIKALIDIAYGGGFSQVRDEFFKILNAFKNFGLKMILIGHLKRTIIGTDKIEIDSKDLNLTGKLRNMIFADMDSIGLLLNKKDKTYISFKPSEDIAAGSRCPHLKGQTFEFDWNKIYLNNSENS